MNDYTEKRSSFRILESLKLKYEVLSEIDYAAAMKLANSASAVGESSRLAKLMDIDARLDEAIYVLGRQAPSAQQAMKLLNQKLQLVVQSIPELQHRADSLAESPAQECELSADSIVFFSDDDLAVGTKLKLRFFLISENRYFETLASVYRKADNDESSRKHRIVACFEGMPSAERDALFQHLFSMQSETLRMRRIKMEEMAESG